MSARYTSPEARGGLSSKATRVCREGEGEGQKRVCVVMRFTSPALSRQLAEAGLEQMHENFEDVKAQWFDYGGGIRLVPGYAGGAGFRALDLTDVLDELTREREGGALCERYELTTGLDLSHPIWFHVHDNQTKCRNADSPVEAAGLVLLALLRERGK